MRAERAGNSAGGLVGIDVVGVAFAVGADARDHRDVVLRDMLEHVDVDVIDPADEADVLAARSGLTHRAEQQPVVAASPTAGCPWRLISSTMSLLILPTSTIFATSTVCLSETRRPSTNSTGRSSLSM